MTSYCKGSVTKLRNSPEDRSSQVAIRLATTTTTNNNNKVVLKMYCTGYYSWY